MLFTFLILLVACLLVGVGIWMLTQMTQQREELGITHGKVVYQDFKKIHPPSLYSKKYNLKGRPDCVLDHGEYRIPVEDKTGNPPRFPYPNHIMQLIAYCILVEEHYGVRPPYGIIRYINSGQSFTIQFTEEYEQQLIALLQEMQLKKQTGEVHRSHNRRRVCEQCGFRDNCPERLT